MKRLLVGTAVVLAVLALGPSASAEETKCTGTIGARTLDNVRVPQGETCRMNGTTVQGTVTVKRDAVLIASGVRVNGNVQAENARNVVVRQGSRIGNDVTVVQGDGAKVVGSRVGGDILYDENDEALRVGNTRVGGDIQAFQNTGGVVIVDNRVDGNLQCKANKPAPTGDGNIVQGNKEDQCAKL